MSARGKRVGGLALGGNIASGDDGAIESGSELYALEERVDGVC